MRIFVTDPEGVEHALDAIEGYQVMEIIRDAGLPIRAECGGCCACATCHVYVAEAWMDRIPLRSLEETDTLDLSAIVEENSRLSCQIEFTPDLDGLQVMLSRDTL